MTYVEVVTSIPELHLMNHKFVLFDFIVKRLNLYAFWVFSLFHVYILLFFTPMNLKLKHISYQYLLFGIIFL